MCEIEKRVMRFLKEWVVIVLDLEGFCVHVSFEMKYEKKRGFSWPWRKRVLI